MNLLHVHFFLLRKADSAITLVIPIMNKAIGKNIINRIILIIAFSLEGGGLGLYLLE